MRRGYEANIFGTAKAIRTVGQFLDRLEVAWCRSHDGHGYRLEFQISRDLWLAADGSTCRKVARRMDAGDFAGLKDVMLALPKVQDPEAGDRRRPECSQGDIQAALER